MWTVELSVKTLLRKYISVNKHIFWVILQKNWLMLLCLVLYFAVGILFISIEHTQQIASQIIKNGNRHPSYSLQNMPKTDFSCRGKILGGYYADADTQCQMFHICVKVAGVGVSL